MWERLAVLFLPGAAVSVAVPPKDSCEGSVGKRACLNAVGCAWECAEGVQCYWINSWEW